MSDSLLLEAAFHAVRRLRDLYDDAIPWAALEQGFMVGGETVRFASRALGIFKPAQMGQGVLSIKTVVPKKGRVNIYDDHQAEGDYYRYALQAGGARENSNRFLWQAKELRQPFIYFVGIQPSVYTALWPCYVEEIHDLGPRHSYADIYVGLDEQRALFPPLVDGKYSLPDTFERRYAVRESRHRLHQSSFRQAVLLAYDNKCAMTGLPAPGLLDAAHVIPDAQDHGEASVKNGIALSKLHHSAFDKHFIGVDPDYCIHVSKHIMELQDGPLLEIGIKELAGKQIVLPRRKEYWPEQRKLVDRFAQYLKSEKG